MKAKPMEKITGKNGQRQEVAHYALVSYVQKKKTFVSYPKARALLETDLEGQFTDLLIDLQHLATARGIDFAERIRIAAEHYKVEA